MKIIWEIEKKDIKAAKEVVGNPMYPFVERVLQRNVNRKNIKVDKDSIIKSMMMALITSQQPSGPNKPVGIFLCSKPFPLTYSFLKKSKNIQKDVQRIMLKNGLNRFINKIPAYFEINWCVLEESNWKISSGFQKLIKGGDKELERKVANEIDKMFAGIGPKQSRNFLQALGLTQYEIPVDSRIISWLKHNHFPIHFSNNSITELDFYVVVQEAIQELAEKAGFKPCVLAAAIFSYEDKDEWTKSNVNCY